MLVQVLALISCLAAAAAIAVRAVGVFRVFKMQQQAPPPHFDAQGQAAEVLQQQLATEPGGCAGLVRQLRNGRGKAAQRRALQQLCQAADHDVLRRQLAEAAGLVTGVVRLLGSRDSGLQQAAAQCLSRLSGDWRTIRLQISSAPGAVEGLVKLLSSSSQHSQEFAAGTLCHLAVLEAVAEEIAAEPGAIEALVQLLGSSSVGVQRAASGALGNLALACKPLQHRIADEEGALEQLVQLLGSSNEGVQGQAAGALECLTHDDLALQDRLAEQPGAIEGLVELISSRCSRRGLVSPAVLAAAAGALGNIAQSNEDMKQWVAAEPGAVEELVMLLFYCSDEVQTAAAWAVYHLVTSEFLLSTYMVLRRHFLASKAVAKPWAAVELVQMLVKGSEESQLPALYILQTVVRVSPAVRQLLSSQPGVRGVLMKLLSSPDKNVQEAASELLRYVPKWMLCDCCHQPSCRGSADASAEVESAGPCVGWRLLCHDMVLAFFQCCTAET